MQPLTEHQAIYDAFSHVCKKAYHSWHMVACSALSKMGIQGLIYDYTIGKTLKNPNTLFVMRQVIYCYIKSIRDYILFICAKIVFIFVGNETYVEDKKIFIIDSYYNIDDVLLGNESQQKYFTGIVKLLRKSGWDSIVIPRFYGSKNPLKFCKIFKTIKYREEKILTEFQLLRFKDYIILLVHIVIYPLRILDLIRCLNNTREELFVKYALIKNLQYDTIGGAVRYLAASRLSALLSNESRCLQWFENQSLDKCFNLGLRTVQKDIKIYGAQLFVWPPELLNVHVDCNDPENLRPNICVVNGKYYINNNIKQCQRIGPSLRYHQIWNIEECLKNKIKKNKALVLLPYYTDQINEIIRIAFQIEEIDNLIFKFHPTTSENTAKSLLPHNATISSKNIYNLFDEVDYVIGASTGSLLEAIAVGVPVISIYVKNAINYSYLPESIGKGVLWLSAHDANEAEQAKNMLLDENIEQINKKRAAVMMIRNELFTRPNQKELVKAFDL